MKRVGEVVRTTSRLAIVRCPDDAHPAIGETLLDEHLERVGRVVDIIGPVSRPYLVVTPGRAPAALLGERVYAR